ncbi:MAG: rhodanese-like domain-containing protein [Bacteriovoracia bacterium]
MAKKFNNVFAQLQHFENQIARLEEKVLQLNQKIEQLVQIERNHLIRVKNHEELSDDFIEHGRKYQDLSPEKAWKLYCNKDFDFILLDVSSKNYEPMRKIPEALHIPWEELPERFYEISSKTTPILVICEDGTSSILACEFMVKRGFFNCSNISGGYKHWKGFQLSEVRSA